MCLLQVTLTNVHPVASSVCPFAPWFTGFLARVLLRVSFVDTVPLGFHGCRRRRLLHSLDYVLHAANDLFVRSNRTASAVAA